ncbi:MAG: divalent-cation tolerance protein CutA [Gemmatimonadales bacterium]|nr:divalent-cation tolerance protein CutA [Gemmatimonadales bacterium]
MTQVLQVTTTLDDRAAAERLARTLVEERFAACAQVAGPVTSAYWWKHKVTTATEWYCHIKTTKDHFPALRERIVALHSAEVPEIIALPVFGGHAEYLQWVNDEVGGEPAP